MKNIAKLLDMQQKMYYKLKLQKKRVSECSNDVLMRSHTWCVLCVLCASTN